MASSFLLARLTRLNLALQRRRERKGNAEEKNARVESRCAEERPVPISFFSTLGSGQEWVVIFARALRP